MNQAKRKVWREKSSQMKSRRTKIFIRKTTRLTIWRKKKDNNSKIRRKRSMWTWMSHAERLYTIRYIKVCKVNIYIETWKQGEAKKEKEANDRKFPSCCSLSGRWIKNGDRVMFAGWFHTCLYTCRKIDMCIYDSKKRRGARERERGRKLLGSLFNPCYLPPHQGVALGRGHRFVHRVRTQTASRTHMCLCISNISV